MTTNPDWVCGTCDGTNLFYVYEAPENGGKFIREEPCESEHVGPFIVDEEELWADPEKVRWECHERSVFWEPTNLQCYSPVNAPELHADCGFYPVGVRLEQVKETP